MTISDARLTHRINNVHGSFGVKHILCFQFALQNKSIVHAHQALPFYFAHWPHVPARSWRSQYRERNTANYSPDTSGVKAYLEAATISRSATAGEKTPLPPHRLTHSPRAATGGEADTRKWPRYFPPNGRGSCPWHYLCAPGIRTRGGSILCVFFIHRFRYIFFAVIIYLSVAEQRKFVPTARTIRIGTMDEDNQGKEVGREGRYLSRSRPFRSVVVPASDQSGHTRLSCCQTGWISVYLFIYLFIVKSQAAANEEYTNATTTITTRGAFTVHPTCPQSLIPLQL